MATEYGIVPISYVGKEANKFFYEPFYQELQASQWGEIFTIDGTIPWGGSRNMIIGGIMTPPLRIDTGCNELGITSTGAIGQRSLNTLPLTGLAATCVNDLVRQAFPFVGGLGRGDANTFILNFVVTRFRQAMQKQLVVNAFFGAKNSGDATLNLTDGLWSVLLGQAQNEGMPIVDAFGGVALSSGDGIEYMRQMVEAQTIELYGVSAMDKMFLISRSVEQQLKRDIIDGAINSGLYRSELENGVMVSRFDGIQVKVMAEFDTNWLNFSGQANGNLALLVAKGNLQMGTDSTSGLNAIEVWDERKDRKSYIRPEMSWGFNYASEKLMVAGYKRP